MELWTWYTRMYVRMFSENLGMFLGYFIIIIGVKSLSPWLRVFTFPYVGFRLSTIHYLWSKFELRQTKVSGMKVNCFTRGKVFLGVVSRIVCRLWNISLDTNNTVTGTSKVDIYDILGLLPRRESGISLDSSQISTTHGWCPKRTLRVSKGSDPEPYDYTLDVIVVI